MAAPLPGDKRAGFMGLIFGAMAAFLVAWGIVHLTNKHHEAKQAHEAGTAAGSR